MFTGLVRTIGVLRRCPGGVRIQADPSALGPPAPGDSISVDGVCLTVDSLQEDGFRAAVSEETLERSTLAERARLGAGVNLEPALRLADRLGGHLVSGHVDGQGTVTDIKRLEGSWRLELAWRDPAWGRYVCDKASITVDGISLTVAGCGEGGARFWIAVIPHTWNATTLRERRVGDPVNLEADLLAKYTERLLQARGSLPGRQDPRQNPPDLDASWLAEHGWS
jgi:riboflavin synthase